MTAEDPGGVRDSLLLAVKVVGAALVVVVALLTFAVWWSQSQHAAIERTAACRSQAAATVEQVLMFRDIEKAEGQAALTEGLVILASGDDDRLGPVAVEANRRSQRVRAYDARLVELARLRADSARRCNEDAAWRIPEALTSTEPN